MADQIQELRMQIKNNITLLIEKEQYQKAVQLLEQYMKMVPDDPEGFSIKAVLAIHCGKLIDAQIAIADGLVFDQNNFDLLYNLAYVYEQKEDYQAAFKIYLQLVDGNYSAEQQNLVAVGLNRTKSYYPKSLEKREKPKLTFFVKQGLDGFLGDIIEKLSSDYETKKVIITQYTQIDEEMRKAKVCWFEWCDELVSYGSKLKLAKEKTIICRLHSYEAFTDYTKNVLWEAVDKVIFVAEHIRKFVLENTPSMQVEQTVVIPNGIDLDKYHFKEKSKGFNIAYVGYINYKKGPMLLLHAFHAIHKSDSRYKLYIAGEFQDHRDVLYFQQMLEEMNLKNSVIFTGWQEDLDSWLEDKNYILCTSILESQNLSVMQAMAKGIKPLIHNFVGAKSIYPDEYIWNTIDDCVCLLMERYQSSEYRNYIQKQYSLSGQMLRIYETVSAVIYTKASDNKSQNQLITIGITNYNANKYVSECLDSILQQTHKNIEILVVDDKSTDGSLQKLRKYAKKYKNIRLIEHTENSGSPDLGRQEIINNASGNYFMLFDSDDYFADRQAIEKLLSTAQLDNCIDYVYCNMQVVNERGVHKEIWKCEQYQPEQIVRENFRRGGSGILNMKGLFKTEFFKKNSIAYLSNGTAGDTLTILSCLKNGMNIRHIDQEMLAYRQHSNNFTFDASKRITSILNIMEYIIDNFDRKIYFPECDWEQFDTKTAQAFQFCLIAEFYFSVYKQYLEGKWMPWEEAVAPDIHKMIEYLLPLKAKIEYYISVSSDLSTQYVQRLNNIIAELKGASKKTPSLFDESKVLVKKRNNKKKPSFFTEEEYLTAKQLLLTSEAQFEKLVKDAENEMTRNNIELAAQAVMRAADFAFRNHAGVFFSARLEKILLDCAKVVENQFNITATNLPVKKEGEKRRVLHVLSHGYETGGHTRLVSRWCEKDTDSTHSVVTLLSDSAPAWLRDNAFRSGGWHINLDQPEYCLCTRAKLLRDIAYSWANVVVLHIHPFDPIATIAFGIDGGPPVILLNHADHVFWLGSSISDRVANIRPAGELFTLTRRGTKRSMLLPIPMVLSQNSHKKDEAKKKLGIDTQQTVLLSIASPYKYVSSGDYDFIQMLRSIENKHQNVHSLVVGPEDANQWQALRLATGNRARAFGLQNNLDVFHSAADVYLDSFCLGSLTASLEVGIKGIPVVCMANGINKILSIDDVSYQKSKIIASDLIEYEKKVDEMIKQSRLRTQVGNDLAKCIKEDHVDLWLQYLNKIYGSLPKEHSILTCYEKISNWDDGDSLWAYLQNKSQQCK